MLRHIQDWSHLICRIHRNNEQTIKPDKNFPKHLIPNERQKWTFTFQLDFWHITNAGMMLIMLNHIISDNQQ